MLTLKLYWLLHMWILLILLSPGLMHVLEMRANVTI